MTPGGREARGAVQKNEEQSKKIKAGIEQTEQTVTKGACFSLFLHLSIYFFLVLLRFVAKI